MSQLIFPQWISGILSLKGEVSVFQPKNVSLPRLAAILCNNILSAIYIDSGTKKQYTWAQTKTAALEFGTSIQKLWGWKKGDVLGLFSPNSIDYPAIMFGTFWAGGTVSPANPAYTVDELAFQLKDSGAKALVTQFAYLEIATKAAQISGIPKDRIILIGDTIDPAGNFVHFYSCLGSSLRDSQCRRPIIDPKKDLGLLVYSSGTTGRPKAVMLSHENIIANQLQIQTTDEGNLSSSGGNDGHGDKIMAVVPYYHVYGRYVPFFTI